jgi:hypothetical protein
MQLLLLQHNMTDTPKYSSIIDEFLDSREPSWNDLGLKDAKSSGDDLLNRTHNEADVSFLDELAEGASKHTAMPPTSKGATLVNRLREKDAATPRLGSGRVSQTLTGADTSSYKSAAGDDNSLLEELTESFESAASSGKVEKKNRSDAEIQRYIHDLLNQGVPPAKIAAQLNKLAEIELFNHQMSTNYLQNNAGMLGMSYMEPNSFMDKNNPSYERQTPKLSADKQAYDKPQENCPLGNRDQCDDTNPYLCSNGGYDAPCDCKTCHPPLVQGEAEKFIKDRFEQVGSAGCIRQAKAWKAAGIKPRAKSVKQITACEGCSYYKKNASTKSCGLYGLPVVGNSAELSAIVNKMTAGVPSKSKRAALVQIANRQGEHIQAGSSSTANGVNKEAAVHQSSFTKERNYGFKDVDHFSGDMVQTAHAKGHSLKAIAAAGEKKFGSLEASKGIREFVASLHKEKGKIVMAKADADYLNNIGIHNDSIVASAKCASCKAHINKEQHKSASTEMVTRAPETFVQATPATVRASQKTIVTRFDSASVQKLHMAGHSVEKIYKAASAKVGSVQASKAIRDWASNLKNTNTKIALSQIDCAVLKKMGVKLGTQNAIIGAEKCGSCNYRNGMHCGLTGGTLLAFPGMANTSSNKKIASDAPEDGRSILKEFDLMGTSTQSDIDMTPPDRAEVQMDSKLNAGDI